MNRIARLVSKLNLLGDKPRVLEDDSAIVYEDAKEKYVGYIINEVEKVVESPFSINGFVPGTTQFLDAELKNNNYLLDRHLKPLLKFSSEKPSKIIEDYYVVLSNSISNTKRVIDISGKAITEHLSWQISMYRIDDVKKIVVVSGHATGIDVILSEKYKQSHLIKSVTDGATVHVGSQYFTIRYKNKNKVIMFDYDGKVVLSIPFGKAKLSENKILLTDKVDKIVTTIPSAYRIL